MYTVTWTAERINVWRKHTIVWHINTNGRDPMKIRDEVYKLLNYKPQIFIKLAKLG